MRAAFLALTIGLFAGLPAQEAVEASLAKSRALTRQEEKQELEDLRAGMLTRMMPERVAQGDRDKRTKWLKKFQVVQSEHFLLFTNGPTSTSKKFARTLEELYEFVDAQFPFEDSDRLMTCYIFKDKSEYTEFCVKISGWDRERAERTAGHANSRYYATYYLSPREDTVFHEATHLIVQACMKIRGVGSWFQEGMAVYCEKTIKNAKPSMSVRSDFRRGAYHPLEHFVGLSSLLGDPDGHGTRNYRHAGALIDFLVNTEQPEFAGKFPAFLAAARDQRARNKRAAEALFRDVYGATIDEVETAWMREHGVRKRRAP